MLLHSLSFNNNWFEKEKNPKGKNGEGSIFSNIKSQILDTHVPYMNALKILLSFHQRILHRLKYSVASFSINHR